MARLNGPAKIWGGNLVPTPTQAAFGSAAWSKFQQDWRDNVAGSNWTDWVKPQVDAAYSVGANCIAMIGCLDGVHSSAITQSATNANWAQLADYCGSLGIALYPKLTGYNQLTGVTNSACATYALSVLGAIAGRCTIIGCDIITEANAWDDGGGISVQGTADRCIAIYNLIKPSTSLLLTFGYGGAFDWNSSECRTWMGRLGAGPCTDYVDFHPFPLAYANPIDPADAQWWIDNWGLDILFGEGGISQTESVTLQNSFYNSMLYLMNDPAKPLLRGLCVWAIADQDTVSSNKWGMFDNSFVARTNRTETFKWYAAAASRPARRMRM